MQLQFKATENRYVVCSLVSKNFLKIFQTKETQRLYFKVLLALVFVVKSSHNVLPNVMFFGDVRL